MESHGRRSKEIVTLLGETTIDRTYYSLYPLRRPAVFPKDALLDIERTSFSPGVRRLMARSGARDSFARAEEDLWEYSGIRVGAKDVERVAEAIGADIERREQVVRAEAMAGQVASPGKPIPVLYVACDGTGVPVTKRETAGRKGKQIDDAKTREAKLGCIFTQTGTDSKGFPLREEGSTTYTGAIETAEVFGERLYAEAVTRGLSHAELVVVLGDGAHWIWNLAALHFPHAIHIVDLYHAREHLYALLKLIFSPGEFYEARCKEWCDWLEKGKVEQIISAASAVASERRACPEIRHDRNRILQDQCGPNALCRLPRPRSLCRLRRRRGRLQEHYRRPHEEIRGQVVRTGSQRHHCPALHPCIITL